MPFGVLSQDLESFFERLGRRFTDILVAELEVLLPHIRHDVRTNKWILGDDQLEDATLRDVMQAVVSKRLPTDIGSETFWKTIECQSTTGGDFDTWIMRARIHALALAVVTEATPKENKDFGLDFGQKDQKSSVDENIPF